MSLTYTETLIVTHCWCGIAVAIPENLHSWAQQRNGRDVYCPIGHVFVFTDTFEQQLERERKRHQATKDLLAHEERSHAATRGHLTKTRNRIAKGVCPCCHRSFVNVRRHMETKHPDFTPEAMPDA